MPHNLYIPPSNIPYCIHRQAAIRNNIASYFSLKITRIRNQFIPPGIQLCGIAQRQVNLKTNHKNEHVCQHCLNTRQIISKLE